MDADKGREDAGAKNHNKYRKDKPWDVEGTDHWDSKKYNDWKVDGRRNQAGGDCVRLVTRNAHHHR